MWGKGGSTIQTAGRTRAEREGNLSPSPPKSISLGLPKSAPWGLWGRVAARLGRGGTAGGQEAQHRRMARPEVGAGTKQPGAPRSLRAEPSSGGVEGLGVRSLPELSMVVPSTAVVAYARDPSPSYPPSPWSLQIKPHWPKAWSMEHGSRWSGVPSSRGTVVGAVPQP